MWATNVCGSPTFGTLCNIYCLFSLNWQRFFLKKILWYVITTSTNYTYKTREIFVAIYKANDWVNVDGRHWQFYLHMTLSTEILTVLIIFLKPLAHVTSMLWIRSCWFSTKIPTVPTIASSTNSCQRNDLVMFNMLQRVA